MDEHVSVGKVIGIVLLIVVILGILSYAFGWLDVFKAKTIGKEMVQTQREIYEESKSYVKGVSDDLARFKYELIKTEDPVEREAIIETIIDRFSDFDVSKLDNPDLQKFLNDVRNGEIN